MNLKSPEKETVLSELQARFVALKGDFVRLDQEVETRIRRWRYAEQSVFELRADYFRRFNERVGQLIDDEPTEAYMFYAYGYDEQERIIFAAFFQAETDPRAATFYDYAEDQINFAEYFMVHHTDQYYLGTVARLVQSAERPLYYAEYGQDGLLFRPIILMRRGGWRVSLPTTISISLRIPMSTQARRLIGSRHEWPHRLQRLPTHLHH